MIYFLVCIQKPTVSSTNSFIIVGYFSENPENKRKFLDNFAKQRGFDPLIAENWYTIQISDIKEEQVCLIFFIFVNYYPKGGITLLHGYKYSLIRALLDIYPDIGLKDVNFAKLYRM